MGYILYKYKESGYSTWVILDLGSHKEEAMASLMKAFFPHGRVLAAIPMLKAYETGVVTDPFLLCNPYRYRETHTVEVLRKTPRDLVALLLNRWETNESKQWLPLVQEIRAKVLHLS